MNYWQQNNLIIILVVLILLGTGPVLAQQRSFVQLHEEHEYEVPRGEPASITLSLLVDEGYHIQADEVDDQNLIPTELYFDAPEELSLGEPVFPEAKQLRVTGEDKPWPAFSDVVHIKVPVEVPGNSEQKSYTIDGTLHYQACDKSKCYFPRDHNFTVRLHVE